MGNCRSICNLYSVMQALGSGKYKSYRKKTSAAETLMTYIDMDQEGLQDDVLTLLIHLGYLTYEEVSESYDESDEELTGLAYIPNEEVISEFEKILRKAKHKELI